MAEHSWFYTRETAIGTTEQIGPVPESELLSIAKAGTVTRTTLVSSPTRSKGGWHQLQQIPGLLHTLEAGERERQSERDRQKQQKAVQRDAEQSQRAAANQQRQAAHAAEVQRSAQISDCQNIDLVTTIRDRVQAILTSSEAILYIAVQKKPLVNLAPDAVVATNRRLIFYRPKLLGRYEFDDYLWLDLANAHIQQNMLGSVFTAHHTSGRALSMDYLTTAGSQALYRLAQEQEERARETRRQMQMEQARAGASQVNVQTGIPQAAPPTPAADDLLKRLATLKAMADQGLITAEDFESRKQQILSQI